MDGISLSKRKVSKYEGEGGSLQNLLRFDARSKTSEPASLQQGDLWVSFVILPPFILFFFFLRQNYIPGNDCSDIKLKWSKTVLLHQCQPLKGQVLVMNVWYLPILLDMHPRRKAEDNLISSAVCWHFRGLWSHISKNVMPGLHLVLLWQGAFGHGCGTEEVFWQKTPICHNRTFSQC